MKRTEIPINKPLHLGLSKLCYMHTGSFRVYIKTKDITDIAKGVETRFDISKCSLDRPLPKGKNNSIIGLMEDELCRKIFTELTALRTKTYSYLTEDKDKKKKQEAQKRVSLNKN